MSLNGARMRYVDDSGEEILVPAKGRTFQIGSYFSCDVILEPQAERLICEITCDAFGRVTLRNQSNKDTAIHLNDKLIHGQRSHPLLHGNRITILDRVYTWESSKMSESEDAPSTPERLPPAEQAPNSCPSLKSHRPQIDKRLTVHNFHYSINSDEEGNTSIESRNESHLEEQESLNYSTPPSTEMPSSCETPKVDLVEATQNKENTATPTASHQQLLQLCALSDVVITSYSPRETGVKVEKSFTCVRKPTKSGKQAAAASVTMSTPKSVYSTPKGGVLSELNDDSCSRDLMDFCTPSTSTKTKRQSSMYLIDLTTPSKLRPSFKPTPIGVDSTDESSDGSPLVIDITKSVTPATPGRSHLAKTPRRPADAAAATPTRTPQSLMKRALLTSTKKNQIASSQLNKTPVATPGRTPRPRNLPRMPFLILPTPEQKEARHAAFEKKRQSLHLGTPRDNKASQVRKSMAAAKRSPSVDMRIKLKAKARRTLNSPKSSSPQSGSSPTMKTTCNVVSHPKCSTPEKVDDSPNDDLSRTFTVMNESGDPAAEGSILGIMSALVTGEVDSLEPTPQPTEISEGSGFVEDQASGNPGTELQSADEKVESPSKDDAENRTESFVESCQEPDKESTENCSIQANEKADKQTIIEDSICEEVHANIPKQLEDDDKLSKVPDICEEESPDIKSSDAFAEEENKEPEPTSRVETPMIRRSLRRLSVDQKAGVATTPRGGSAETKTEEGSKRGTRRASCSALADTQDVSGTPRRKRRLSEQMCTPTRQSKRLMSTPKSTLQVDDSIGDMGVIVEEDDDEKSCVVEDENYGKELPCEEPDNVDYHGLRDLLKTPKNCSTPRFKGLREMMRTPKVPASPIFGNIEELLDNSPGRRSITVGRVAVDNSKALEGVLKTPSARNIMVPNEPASAVLKSRGDPLATTTEYDLEMTNTTLHLDQIFDDVPSPSAVANNNDTEAEINVTTVSTASSGLDPLKESSVSSEAPLSVCKLKNEACITSTTYKAAMQADLELSTCTEEGGEAASRPSSVGLNEMSGMQLLDQTSDSIFSEPLIVSGVVESSNVTVDETRALGQTTFKPLEVNDVDTDSNVGLTEPLVLSDDDDEAQDSRVTPKKSTAPKEVSMAYKLEESTASEAATLNQSNSKQSLDLLSRENDSLIEEVSLIEVNESEGDEKSSIIELDSFSDTTEAEPARDASEAVELTIVDCDETSSLDATQEEEEVATGVDKKPVESVDKEAEIVIKVPASRPPVSEEVLEKTDVKGNDVSAAEDPEALPTDATANSSLIVEEKLSITEEHSTCEAAEYQSISHKLATNKLAEEREIGVDGPLDSSPDNDVVLEDEIPTNIDQNPTNFEEDQSVINPIASTEEKITENDGRENDISAVVDAEILPFDLTADNSVQEEFLSNVEQKPIDSDLIRTTNDLDTANPAKEDASPIDASPPEEQAEDVKTGDDTQETAGAVDSDISPLDSTADSFAIHINPQAEPLTNEDQKPTNSKSSITNEDLPKKTAESAIDVVLPFEESPVQAELSNATTDEMAVESQDQDAEQNKIERIPTATKPEAGEVSILKEPKSDAEPGTSEEPLVKAATNDDTAEKPEKEIIKELPGATVDGETSKPHIHEVEVVSPTNESAPEASASPCPSETSAVQDTGSNDPVQEVHKNSSILLIDENIKEDEAETGIMEDTNPCAEQKSNGDESKMIATATADEKCSFQDVEIAEDFKAAERTACDPQESDVAAIGDSAVTEKNEDELNVNQTKDDSTSLEATQDESCAQDPISPKVVPPTVNVADGENSPNTSSIIMESFTEPPKPKPDSTEQNQLHSTKNESKDEVNQLDKSCLAEDLTEDCFVQETPKTKSFVNDSEVVVFSEERTDQQVEFKPIEESSDRLEKSNEVEETSIDTSKDIETTKESLKEHTCHIIPSATTEDEQPGEFTTKEKCHDESIAEIMESSAKLEDSSSSAVQEKSVSENREISITEEAPNKSIADDSATEDPSIAMINEDAKTVCDHESARDSESPKDEPENDESTSNDANSEGKSRDRTVAEEAVHLVPLASPRAKVAAGAVNSLSESDHISIEEKAKEAVKNPSLTEDEVMSEELAKGTSEDHHINAKSLNQDTLQTAAVKEVSDVIELSDDSESNPSEDPKPGPVPASEEDTSRPIEETLPNEDPRETKVEDVPEEATPILKDRQTVKEISDVIELSDDSESNPSEDPEEDAGETQLPTEDSKKANIENVPEEVIPIAENTLNASLSIETIGNQEPNDGQVGDVSDELQNGARAAASLTNQEEQPETPQASEKLAHVADTTSIRESVANVEDEKSQHKSSVEGSADEVSPSEEKDQPSGEVTNSVEFDVEASKEKVLNSDNIQTDKLATPLNSSSEPETCEKFKETSPEPSVSIKHSTMEAVQSPCTPPIRHEDDPSAKEELKPVKRATRKASASVETPAEEALGKPSRRARKPSAEVEALNSNDIHEKPKRRVIRKASAEVEPTTLIADKKENNEEDVLKVISEEAHSSTDNEPPKELVSNEKLEEDVLEKPKRRARKPSAEVKSSDITEKPKRRARKPSAEVSEKQKEIEGEPKEEEQAHSSKMNQQHELQEEAGSSQKKEEMERREEHIKNKEEPEEANEENDLQEKEAGDKETTKEVIKSSTERPKRRGRKASAEETETTTSKKPKMDDKLEVIEETGGTPTFPQMEQEQETQKPELPKRRGRKASAQEDGNNVVKLPTSDKPEEKPEEAHTEGRSRRRGRRPSTEVLEGTAASQPKSENGNASEDQPSNSAEPKVPQKRTRKSLEFAPAEVLESATETEHIERPKRRGRKPSVDIENVVQDVPDKPRRRGRTPAEPEEQQPSEEEPDKKSRRTARKPSAQTVEVEQLKDIEEVAEAEHESETPLPEEEEPKTRRRGRKLQLETVEKTPKNTAEVGHSRLRGRKATEDEVAKSEGPIEGDPDVEGEQHNIEEEAEVTAAEKKTKTRRVRKASANVDEGTAVPKKTNTRRGRKEDTHDDAGDGQEREIDLQQVPTESVPAVVIMSSQIGDGAVGSEDDLTPRRREGRNVPRKNYDETSDEDKQRSARRPRKPAASKVLALKAPEEDSTPLTIRQPVEEVETPADTAPTAEPTSTQRREGRNVPRKNYTEVPDDDKPSTSRNRRVRNLTAKALELIVDSSPRPNTPKGRKAKAAAKDEVPPAKRASLEAVPSTQAESAAAADEEPAPVVVKGRAARRKADDDLPEPSKRGGRGQHEDTEEQPEAKPAPRRARATARKAQVESELNEAAVPTKKARRGGSRAKTPVMPPEDKSATDPEAHSAPIRKGRGGTRAKTPLDAVVPEDPSSKPADEPPAKKPTARSRARGGTKVAVAVPEPEQQPAQDSDVEPAPSTSTARGGGRAKKVHFEPTETATASDAPKRATRSRRK